MKNNRSSFPDKFCPLPFIQLSLLNSGDVFTCCQYPLLLGNVKESSISQIWNGEKARGLRREFIVGEVKTCAQNIKLRGCNRFNDQLLNLVDLAEVQSEPAQTLDVILNGQCNLECVMCPIWSGENGAYDQSSFWSEGEGEIFPKLKALFIKSGEPFIQKDIYRLITAVSSVNKECRWYFTTNGQYRLNSYIIKHLDMVRLSGISISIDSLDPKTYAQIRKKGELRRSLDTLNGFSCYRSERSSRGEGFSIHLNMAVQIANYSEIYELIKFCEAHDCSPVFLYVSEPKELSLSSLDENHRSKILKNLLEFTEKLPLYSGKLNTIIAPLIESLPRDQAHAFALWHYSNLFRQPPLKEIPCA